MALAEAVEPEVDPDDYGRTGEPDERAQPGKPYVQPSRLGILVALFGGLAIWRGFPILVIVAGIIVMIFFHELGHFVMARRAGMKVTEFMIGFGPRIFSFRRGDVEYGLKAIPAGAYVKIIGMANIEEVPSEDEPKTYRQKGYWARMGVAVAGSTMHFVMALVLIGLSLVFVGRVSEERWEVATIAPDSAADLAGVRTGDRVTSMDGVTVRTHEEMATQAQKHPGDRIPVVVERDGERVELTAEISSRFVVFGTNGGEFQVYENGAGGLSISLGAANRLTASGLRDGDTLTAIDGREVTSAAEARRLFSDRSIASSGDADLTVVHPDGRSAVVAIDVGSQLGLERSMGFFGVGKELVPERLGVLEAVPASFEWFGEILGRSVVGVGQFFAPSNLASFAERAFSTVPGEGDQRTTAQTNKEAATEARQRDSKRVTSIVGAVLLGEQLTEAGWGDLLAFFALLNMAIGVLNLLPLPPFDGGHVVIATYERIRELLRRDGRRYFADANKIMPVAIAVVSVMVIVGLMALYLDLADPVRV